MNSSIAKIAIDRGSSNAFARQTFVAIDAPSFTSHALLDDNKLPEALMFP